MYLLKELKVVTDSASWNLASNHACEWGCLNRTGSLYESQKAKRDAQLPSARTRVQLRRWFAPLNRPFYGLASLSWEVKCQSILNCQ